MPEDAIDGQQPASQSSVSQSNELQSNVSQCNVPGGYVADRSSLAEGPTALPVEASPATKPVSAAPAPAAVSTFESNFSQAMDSLAQSELLQRAPDLHQGALETIFQGDPNLRFLTPDGIVEVPPAEFFTLPPDAQGALKPSVIDPTTGKALDQRQGVEASRQGTDGGGDSTNHEDDAEPEMNVMPAPAEQATNPAQQPTHPAPQATTTADAKEAQDAAKQEALKQALTAKIVDYFTKNHVPQAWIDKASTFVSEGLDKKVDPRIIAAVLVSESGGVRYPKGSNNPFGLGAGLARYDTPEEAIADAAKTLHRHIFRNPAPQNTAETLYSGRGNEGGRMQHGKWVQDNYAGYCTSGCDAEKFGKNVNNAGADRYHLDHLPVP